MCAMNHRAAAAYYSTHVRPVAQQTNHHVINSCRRIELKMLQEPGSQRDDNGFVNWQKNIKVMAAEISPHSYTR